MIQLRKQRREKWEYNIGEHEERQASGENKVFGGRNSGCYLYIASALRICVEP